MANSNDMTLIAHTANALGQMQTLKDHLDGTASLAKTFGDKFGAGEYAEMVGKIHDLGKATPAFQNYLLNNGAKSCHSNVGALWIKEEPCAAIAVNGHHTRLCDLGSLEDKLKANNSEQKLQQILSFIQSLEINVFTVPEKFQTDHNTVDFFIRMIYSCLIDADRLDTARHSGDKRTIYPDVHQLIKLFDQWYKNNIIPNNQLINQIRAKIFNDCLQEARKPMGFFGLNVGTGMGKTLSGMKFCLEHAKQNKMDGVIIVLPFLSIIEQNAGIYKEIFGGENVIEHHSGVNIEGNELDKTKDSLLKATENWDAPVIVTTLVQFLETLFAANGSQVRKLHNMANKVIFMDEIQAIPLGLLKPTIDVFKQLKENYNCSFLFSTATPFDYKELDLDVNIISSDAQRLKRANYIYRTDVDTNAKVISLIQNISDSVLCIVNTKKKAYELYKLLDYPNKYHLSTSMYPSHRKRIIQDIKSDLAKGERVIVVSTQLIEAGVDLDFPNVIRDMAPMDSLCQSAGRCNREGKLKSGNFYIVDLKNSIPAYKLGIGELQNFISKGSDLEDFNIIQEYFKRLFTNKDLDEKRIIRDKEYFRFQQIAKKYKVINEDSVSVIIQEEEIKDEIAMAKCGKIDRQQIRKMQQYMISIRPDQAIPLKASGTILQILDSDLYIWQGEYSQDTGISEYLVSNAVPNPTNFII